MAKPALGFGTAPILGRIDRRSSLAALGWAYDRGVRHFDTARSYGWGDAEGLLGDFLRERGDSEAFVVTKCGILPPKKSNALGTLKTAAQKVVRQVPALRPLARRVGHSGAFALTYSYDLAKLASSVETSLRELKRPIDVLLLHSYNASRPGIAEVADWMQRLVQSGDVRAFGFSIGDDLQAGITHLDAEGLLGSAWVQAPMSDDVLALASYWKTTPLMVHSPFSYLRSSADRQSSGLAGIYRDLTAMGGCCAVVCSMFSRSHIDDNIEAVSAA